MITLEDCIGLCGLSEEEVLAIAEHEHLPEIAATALAQYLLSQEHGSEKVRDMIVDDIRQAQFDGNREHVLSLLHALHHDSPSSETISPPLEFPLTAKALASYLLCKQNSPAKDRGTRPPLRWSGTLHIAFAGRGRLATHAKHCKRFYH